VRTPSYALTISLGGTIWNCRHLRDCGPHSGLGAPLPGTDPSQSWPLPLVIMTKLQSNSKVLTALSPQTGMEDTADHARTQATPHAAHSAPIPDCLLERLSHRQLPECTLLGPTRLDKVCTKLTSSLRSVHTQPQRPNVQIQKHVGILCGMPTLAEQCGDTCHMQGTIQH
jgi:hypothetical protein